VKTWREIFGEHAHRSLGIHGCFGRKRTDGMSAVLSKK
jgi:hypothetical protein